MRSTSLVTVLHMALLLPVAALALAAGTGLPGLYVATIAAGLARAAMLWALVLRGGTRPGRVRRDLLRSLMVSSLPPRDHQPAVARLDARRQADDHSPAR